MKPATYRLQTPSKQCGTCRHAAVPYDNDNMERLLCLFGENRALRNSEDLGMYGRRAVRATGICNDWEKA